MQRLDAAPAPWRFVATWVAIRYGGRIASRSARAVVVANAPSAKAPHSRKLRVRGSASYRLGPVPERPALQDPSDDLG